MTGIWNSLGILGIDKACEKRDTPLNNLWDYLENPPKTPLGPWICSLYLGWPTVQCTGMESPR